MIAIICAMKEELASFIEKMTDKKETSFLGVSFYEGKLFNKDVVLVQSGMGKVDSAKTTTLLLEHFNIDLVFNIGLGGGNGKYVSKGDFVVSDKVAYHDVDCCANDSYVYGQMQSYPLFLEADKETVTKLKQLDNNVIVGGILSGDCFVSNQSFIKERLDYFDNNDGFKPCVFDMEGASIGQICHRLNTKFVIIRYVSDIATVTNQFDSYKQTKYSNLDILVEIIEKYLLSF